MDKPFDTTPQKSFQNWSKKSSIHGFSHAGNSKTKKTCIFWSISSIICLGLLLYFLSYRLEYYVNSGVVTSYEFVQERGGIEFPEVKICLENGYDSTDQYYFFVIIVDILQKHLYEIRDTTLMKLAIADYILSRRKIYKILMKENRDYVFKDMNYFLTRLDHKFVVDINNKYLNFIMGNSIAEIHDDIENCPFRFPDRVISDINDYRNNSCSILRQKAFYSKATSYLITDTIRYEKFCQPSDEHFQKLSNSDKCLYEYLAKLLDDNWSEIKAEFCDPAEESCSFFSVELLSDSVFTTSFNRTWSEIWGEDFKKVVDGVEWYDVLTNVIPKDSSAMMAVEFAYNPSWGSNQDWARFDPNNTSSHWTHYGQHFNQSFIPIGIQLWNIRLFGSNGLIKMSYMAEIGNLQIENNETPEHFEWRVKSNNYINNGIENKAFWVDNLTINGFSQVYEFAASKHIPYLLNPVNNVVYGDFAGSGLVVERDFVMSKSARSSSCLSLKVKDENGILVQKSPGSSNGLRLALLMPSKNAIIKPKQTFRELSQQTITINNVPYIFKSGEHTKIALTKVEKYRSLKPKGSCDGEHNDRPILECFEECFLEKLNKEPCGCLFAYADEGQGYSYERECTYEELVRGVLGWRGFWSTFYKKKFSKKFFF